MARHSMNKMNRALLDRASANPAAIAEAAMGSGVLPEHNPAPIQNPGPINYPGLPPKPTTPGNISANLLSAAQQTWLKRRALWFASALQQMTGDSIDDPDIIDRTAYLAAVALVGDDYDPLTQGITPGWTDEQWSAAYNYVKTSLVQWWHTAYDATPASKHQGHIEIDSMSYGVR
jgi:hypothetical protein